MDTPGRHADDLIDGRYEIGETVGAGGTGTVRRAWDTLLARPVALKMLRAGALDDDLHRARLRAEARLAGALVHPGIAQVYDYGEDPSTAPPTPYIVMQYVDGKPLSQILRERHRLPAEEVMALVARVATALETAHAEGIVHRDLKPANILVTPDGDPVLVDFGIARSDSGEPLTLTGTIVGTVDYISPEQTSGQSATPRSDIYELGMVAYEAISGRRPFHRESQLATALAHLNDEAPALPDDVPADARDLVMAMIAKRPEDRPRSAAEVAMMAAAASGGLVEPAPSTVAMPQSGIATSPVTAGRHARALRWRPPPVPRRSYLAGVAALLAVVGLSLVAARQPPSPEPTTAEPTSTTVPRLVGTTAHDAVRVLESLGLDARRTSVDVPGAAAGEVVWQSPAPRHQVDEGSVVTLEVASGFVRLDADDVLGLGYADARSRLDELGLVAGRREVVRNDGYGTVVAVGDSGRLELGTEVTLSIAIAPPTPTPAVSQGGTSDEGPGKSGHKNGGNGDGGKGKH